MTKAHRLGQDVVSDAQESSGLRQDSAKRVWEQFDQSAQNSENAFELIVGAVEC